MERYNRWVLKQASTAQCSPALMAAALICAFVGVGYIYFKVILTTVLVVLALVLGLAIAAGCFLLIRQLIRWNRTAPAPAPADDVLYAEVSASTVSSNDTMVYDAATKAISDEAEMLADDVLELAWSPDGKTLIGRTAKH